MATETIYSAPILARCLGRYGGSPGPTVIGIGGIHGNEPAGMFALRRVLRELETLALPFRGEIVGLAGNLAALARGTRYVDCDLNRLWQPEQVRALKESRGRKPRKSEETEQLDLLDLMEESVRRSRGPVLFLDLHTTSSEGEPFVVINDTLGNRRLALALPVPVILGLEETLEGTLLNYVNQLGHLAIGFEGGQHGSPASVQHDEAAIWLILAAVGCFNREAIPQFSEWTDRLARRAEGLPPVMEVRYRHAIAAGQQFVMEPGFTNFQPVKRGTLLARTERGEIRAREDGRLFMPLYQKQGDDGFFLVREVSPFWLAVSRHLRRLRLDRALPLLPGVKPHPSRADTFLINPKLARWGVREFFHLLGFRRERDEGTRLAFSRRREPSASI